ncbi:MAG: 4-hydroxythreonine-4-phosphate dehydrogenase PdxA [Thermodesulfovibrionia bacterium]
MKRVAITMGEPGGIGPEVIVKALFMSNIREICEPIVIGNVDVLKEAIRLTGLMTDVKELSSVSEYRGDRISLINTGPTVSIRPYPSSDSGNAIVEYIKKAVEFAIRGEVDAIVTAPISKESLHIAGYTWRGHTEMLAELTGSEDYAMMFVGESLKVILCTIHIPLRDVPNGVNESRVLETIRLARKGMEMLGIDEPKIAISGLNPHAGEGGLLGREEMDIIIPAIRHAQREDMNVSGPYPPDVVFYKAYRGDFDIVVAMYHDQGLIPFKMLEFEKGVNVTVGLPIIRTSPDHGTGFDIAWQNKADPSSMIEAIKLAVRLKRV